MTEALITPLMLQWARVRAQISVDDVAKAAGVTAEKVAAWENGVLRPTLRQAQRVANKLNIPFGYLYLAEPPPQITPLTDFRKLPSSRRLSISPNLYELVQQTIRKQEWLSDYLISQDAKRLPFIGKFSVQDDLKLVVEDIVYRIGINDRLRTEAQDHSQFVRLLAENCATVGIALLRTGVVGNNNRRILSVEEFRGFAISDAYAPFILINSKDAKSAQVFTIVHELAHLWIGESGISNSTGILGEVTNEDTVSNAEHRKIEDFCNAVAAQTLVPAEGLIDVWQTFVKPVNHQTVTEIAKRYWVSNIVILRRALDLELIDKATFFELYEIAVALQPVSNQSGEGGSFFNTFFARHNKSITRSILNAVYEGDLLYRDAADLLGVKVKTLDELAQRLEPA